jgi:hypothetical protein
MIHRWCRALLSLGQGWEEKVSAASTVQSDGAINSAIYRNFRIAGYVP